MDFFFPCIHGGGIEKQQPPSSHVEEQESLPCQAGCSMLGLGTHTNPRDLSPRKATEGCAQPVCRMQGEGACASRVLGKGFKSSVPSERQHFCLLTLRCSPPHSHAGILSVHRKDNTQTPSSLTKLSSMCRSGKQSCPGDARPMLCASHRPVLMASHICEKEP